MKIEAARVIVCSPGRNFVTLKIETDQGVYGIGDAPTDTRTVSVNGRPPAIDGKGNAIRLAGVPVKGALPVPGQAIPVVAVPGANNRACR
jgi:hypothetical protein